MYWVLGGVAKKIEGFLNVWFGNIVILWSKSLPYTVTSVWTEEMKKGVLLVERMYISEFINLSH